MEAGCDVRTRPSYARERPRIEKALTDFIDAQVDALDDGAVRPAFRAVRDFVLQGGKRLRPLLCYWGWRGAGGEDRPEIIRAAAALEIFHAFCLIHDDIIDDSDVRRGHPTLHRALAAQHTTARWRGDGRRFGVATAILAGDLCMTWADELLYTSGLEPERLAAVRRCYHDMRTEVMYGQYLDILEQARGTSCAERSMTVVRYKSAKYTVERPLHVGGTLAGAPPELLAAYSAFGLALGEAFQLRDDILGAFGDPGVTGKANLDDFREGKPTVLIAHAVRNADAAQRRLIDALHGDPRLGEAEAGRLREVLVDTGALAAVEGMIDRRGERALTVLEAAGIPEPARRALTELTAAAISRAT